MEKLTIGPYARNATKNTAYYLIDEFGFMATNNPPNNNKGDSLGGMKDMFFCYDDVLLLPKCEDMWYWNSYGEYVGQRHPLVHPDDHPMSRDHYVSTLLVFKMFNDSRDTNRYLPKIKEITDNTGYIISKMARRPVGLKWWSKAIQGKKGHQFLYHWSSIISALFIYLPAHLTLGKILNFGTEVDQDEYDPANKLQLQPKWKQKLAKIVYPSYAMLITGWKLYVLKGFPILRKINELVYRPMIGKTNYVQQMLFGMKGIPRDKIESFKPMQGGRWSGYLNSRNDRNMWLRDPQPEYNNLDVDIARKLYNETQL